MPWLDEGFMKGFEGICVENPCPECNRRMNKQYRELHELHEKEREFEKFVARRKL